MSTTSVASNFMASIAEREAAWPGIFSRRSNGAPAKVVAKRAFVGKRRDDGAVNIPTLGGIQTAQSISTQAASLPLLLPKKARRRSGYALVNAGITPALPTTFFWGPRSRAKETAIKQTYLPPPPSAAKGKFNGVRARAKETANIHTCRPPPPSAAKGKVKNKGRSLEI